MSQYENSLFSYIEARLIPLERAGKCYFFRNNSFSGRIQRYNGSTGFIKNSKKGTPDVVLCMNGNFIGLELKTPTGKQSSEQKEAQVAIESAGGKYYIVRSSEMFEAVLKELL